MTDLSRQDSRQNVFKSVQAAVVRAVDRLAEAGKIPAGLDAHKATAEPPRDPSHGDVSTNAAMLLAKPAGMKPRDLAQLLADELARDAELQVIEAAPAGPGFVNLRLAPGVWTAVLRMALLAGERFGDSDMGAGRKVNVEYVSANPTGPMHVGHARGAVVGDALARLLAKAGFAVSKEYYINDAGAQVDVLARSAHLRYREALGEAIGEIPAGLYPGDYLQPVGAALAAQFGDRWRDAPEAEWLAEIRAYAIDAMMALIKQDLAALGVVHDVFSSERALVAAGGVEEALKLLEEKGLVYVGVLEPPKGKPNDEWEPRPQTLFKSSAYGDDVDRPLKKSDGTWTYFAADIAYHWDKARRGAPTLIDVWGVDHGGYVKRVAAAVTALTDGAAKLDVKLCALVNLTENGQPVKMSKRAGTFVTLRDVVDAVGPDVVRFTMLTRKNDATLDFDLKKVLEQSKDNPVFYVQYAHARAVSVLRNAAELAPNLSLEPEALEKADFSLLTDEAEIGLIKHVASWPRLVEAAAEAHEAHRIAFYLGELAAQFHALWNKGRDDSSLRFILPDAPGATQARLALVRAVMGVIASGLAVMGVTPVQEMR